MRTPPPRRDRRSCRKSRRTGASAAARKESGEVGLTGIGADRAVRGAEDLVGASPGAVFGQAGDARARGGRDLNAEADDAAAAGAPLGDVGDVGVVAAEAVGEFVVGDAAVRVRPEVTSPA